MNSSSPPKPWERTTGPSTGNSVFNIDPHGMSSTAPPSLPDRPSSLSSIVNHNAANYTSFGSPYGTPGASFGAPTYGNSFPSYNMGSRYGGYGNMFGYGSSPYGAFGQPPGGMADPGSMTGAFNQNTQATFQLIENVVGAFTGVAQMLESTYMATHSSFFAMISVAEQFSNLRNTLGSILGIFTLVGYVRSLIARLTGRPPPANADHLTASDFATYQAVRPSKKPFVIFLAAVIGLPYLMSRLIRSISSHTPAPTDSAMSIADLEFCRVLYDYPPASSPSPPDFDLRVKTGDFVAVLSKSDPGGKPSDWWQCRTRDHRIGYLPGVYLQPLIKPGQEMAQIEHGRVNTISSILGNGSRESEKCEQQKLPVQRD